MHLVASVCLSVVCPVAEPFDLRPSFIRESTDKIRTDGHYLFHYCETGHFHGRLISQIQEPGKFVTGNFRESCDRGAP